MAKTRKLGNANRRKATNFAKGQVRNLRKTNNTKQIAYRPNPLRQARKV